MQIKDMTPQELQSLIRNTVDDKEARAIEMLKRKKQEIKDSLKSKKGAAVMGKMQLPT